MKEFDNLCKECMQELNGKEICANCGCDQNFKQEFPYLKIGEMLEQRYLIGKKIHRDDYEIGYVAYDMVMKAKVYIKEFYPNNLCERRDDSSQVKVFDSASSQFSLLMDEFLDYFRTAAKLRSLIALIPIYNIFTENNTAYAVLEFQDGITLEQFVKNNGGHISWDSAKPLFMPVLSALSELNSLGINHLSICPENLIINKDRKMKIMGMSLTKSRAKNNIIKKELHDGYSALEQYEASYDVTQATDVYGFTACLFYALTGEKPKSALKRKSDDRLLIQTDILNTIPQNVVSALADGLQVYKENRIQSFEDLRYQLSDIKVLKEEAQNYISDNQDIKDDENYNMRKSNLTLLIISAVVAFLVLVSIGAFWLFGDSLNLFNKKDASSDENSQSSSEVSSDTDKQESDSTQITVPNLVGKSYEDVKDQAINNGEYQVLMISEEFSDLAPQGHIISQTPKAGDKIDKGSAVVVTVSKGLKARKLPKIEGLSLSDASVKLSEEGFIPVQIQDYSDTIKEGYVIDYYDHNAFDTLEYGSEVKIVVSKGSK